MTKSCVLEKRNTSIVGGQVFRLITHNRRAFVRSFFPVGITEEWLFRRVREGALFICQWATSGVKRVEKARLGFESQLRGLFFFRCDRIEMRIGQDDALTRRIEPERVTIGENDGLQTAMLGFELLPKLARQKAVGRRDGQQALMGQEMIE